MNNKNKRGLLTWLSALLAITALAATYKLQAAPNPNIPQQQQTSEQALPIKDVKRFTTAISQIKNYYVKEVKDEDLFANAIRGMLTGLDPHSAYLDQEEFNELKTSTSGEFTGLGIEVTMENGLIKVITPIDDTPAYRAGVKASDLIVRLDDLPVKGLTLRNAVNKMRGKKGSTIELTVLRKGEKKPLVIKVKRDTIQIQSVKSRLIDNDIGYVRISHFQATTAKDFVKSIKKLTKETKNKKLAGLILDLRNNPGGLLNAAIEVSDVFIHNDKKGEEELIVYTEGRLPGSEFRAHAKPGDLLKNAPVVVLINQGSASGSEIVAGALQDNNRAVLLGTKTFGKGSVQTVLPLDIDRAVKLTTALYYTPSGRSIQATGIVPDILVEHVDVPKKEENAFSKLGITEASLSGHLANGNEAAESQPSKKIDKKTQKRLDEQKDLLAKDYQLNEAVNLMRGMTVLKRPKA